MGDHREQLLLARFNALPDADKDTLLDFLAFLYDRSGGDKYPAAIVQPLDIERPESETVVAAMRRLTKTYSMLDIDTLFKQAGVLMSEHLIGQRPAVQVIDDLETLFRQRYQEMAGSADDSIQ
ncbi:MAG: hypothetical protein DHS20C01_20230 [marine bacterium B5-7]|nr:MAG: hypothetical protein DHS20C01_20230 [marine bacterium B5-7]